ncbi:transcriptional regulator (plasmid) [Haloferax mediterranei ATCC 33500]|uniref:Transcriptional regulator n=1 Tax=Haloferax mediterranei (strain ATCC 33500 / DSM 1411 / JCM 8866 / NBRC 14739 / NCIMB 2177 / R-4) TaxID=523841 RepID=I3R9I3_HALMT|nr:PQQ-binding-like beta-propeller repeat protein [Haloferax mediterranei]AFK20893.1 Tup1 like transcriptional repressor [Haloferax mediterranei ATCC 33500]AHZ24238.1 transcriptional regulator [Haloferax mediterranei ATCC 33500]EMA05317.1 Tup1 like transcriptional repressor [Haloferax mediterranei ATCC 33500]MDX5989881.1 PQQ-binding-like beta-propeller repeat protein [Haloferax mediterranei ATCC 33500]QCQ77322.1 transcriptional regulator [Haloferax mediterranei ATCC 33500]
MTDFLNRHDLGDLEPAASRHNWARSAVAAADEQVFVGTADGRIAAFGSDLEDGERWSTSGENRIVSMAATDDCLVVGERGGDGILRVLDPETGEQRWEYATTDDIGTATKDSLFFLPYIVDVAVTETRVVAAARRYERDGKERLWTSVVFGFDHDGELQWRYRVSASPIALDTEGGRVAVAYNRCPKSEQDGLVVLDSETGDPITTWDPEVDAERRVGDVAFAADGDIAVSCHGDKRGYLLDSDGRERWRVDLATKQTIDGETVYAYPNHVCVADDGVVFVTGNTFAESTRDPDGRHPQEHTVFGVKDGEQRWAYDSGGFARGVESIGERVVVPSAQNFRRRSAETHGVHVFDAESGHVETSSVSGIPTAVAIGGDVLAVVEEPVEYHDEGVTHGAYRLNTRAISKSKK